MAKSRKTALVDAEQILGPVFIPAGQVAPMPPMGMSWTWRGAASGAGFQLTIETKEGVHDVTAKDWRLGPGPHGEFWVVKDEIFSTTYAPVEEHRAVLGDCLTVAPPADGQPFGWAIKQMQNGARVQREGWNGKGMYLYLDRGAIRTALTVVGSAGAVSYEPCIVMFTAQGRHQPGWLASQADMLATDWRIVES